MSMLFAHNSRNRNYLIRVALIATAQLVVTLSAQAQSVTAVVEQATWASVGPNSLRVHREPITFACPNPRAPTTSGANTGNLP
jgi:hypothetical protein